MVSDPRPSFGGRSGALTLVVEHQSDEEGEQDGQRAETLHLLNYGL
jgi:hypothetical protein